jgi:hypothetical protein
MSLTATPVLKNRRLGHLSVTNCQFVINFASNLAELPNLGFPSQYRKFLKIHKIIFRLPCGHKIA